MIRILTLDREYGSGGAGIAKRVAAHFNWKLWDQLLTNEIAGRMECDCKVVEEHEEKRDPLFYRLARAFMRGSYEGSLNAPRLKAVDTDCIREVAENVVREAAEKGNCVIVGRGSAYYLGARPDAFHVFIYAPFEDKVRRLRQQGRSQSDAEDLARSVDVDRSAFIKKYFNIEWPDRHRFHLMLNSAVGDDIVVETIINGIGMFDKRMAAVNA
jgi:cytidylate kinase